MANARNLGYLYLNELNPISIQTNAGEEVDYFASPIMEDNLIKGSELF
jgi:hypothetical protein